MTADTGEERLAPFCQLCRDTGKHDIGGVSLSPGKPPEIHSMMTDCDYCAWHRMHLRSAVAAERERCLAEVRKNSRHVALSPGVGTSEQRYALAVLDDVIAHLEIRSADAGGRG